MTGSISSRVAPDKATNFFTEENVEPLLTKDGATVATSVNSDEPYIGTEGSVVNATAAKPTNAQVLKSVVAFMVSVLGAAASVAAFILKPDLLVFVAGGICVINFPIVTYKEKKLMFLPSRKKTVEQLECTSRMLKSEAGILEEEIEYLLGHVSRFGEVEQELKAIARAQGSSSEELLELVRANEETMDLMRENLRQKVIQDVIEITIRSDKEGNQEIDRVEAKLLALKITVKLEAYGVVFDENKFLQAVALNPTLWGVAGTVRKLLPCDEERSDDESAALDNDTVYDMFHMSREDQQQRRSALAARSEGRRGARQETCHVSLARSAP